MPVLEADFCLCELVAELAERGLEGRLLLLA